MSSSSRPPPARPGHTAAQRAVLEDASMLRQLANMSVWGTNALENTNKTVRAMIRSPDNNSYPGRAQIVQEQRTNAFWAGQYVPYAPMPYRINKEWYYPYFDELRAAEAEWDKTPREARPADVAFLDKEELWREEMPQWVDQAGRRLIQNNFNPPAFLSRALDQRILHDWYEHGAPRHLDDFGKWSYKFQNDEFYRNYDDYDMDYDVDPHETAPRHLVSRRMACLDFSRIWDIPQLFEPAPDDAVFFVCAAYDYEQIEEGPRLPPIFASWTPDMPGDGNLYILHIRDPRVKILPGGRASNVVIQPGVHVRLVGNRPSETEFIDRTATYHLEIRLPNDPIRTHAPAFSTATAEERAAAAAASSSSSSSSASASSSSSAPPPDLKRKQLADAVVAANSAAAAAVAALAAHDNEQANKRPRLRGPSTRNGV